MTQIQKKMVLEIPDELVLRPVYSTDEFMLDVAVLLYQKRVLSLAAAADWVGLSRLAFQKVLKERAIWLHYAVEDLHEELATFEKLGA